MTRDDKTAMSEHRESVNDHFVADGRENALDGAYEHLRARRSEIVARLEASYSQQLADAGMFRRLLLIFRMQREIDIEMDREIEKVAPSDALYFQN